MRALAGARAQPSALRLIALVLKPPGRPKPCGASCFSSLRAAHPRPTLLLNPPVRGTPCARSQARVSAFRRAHGDLERKHHYTTGIPGARPGDYVGLVLAFVAGTGIGFSLLYSLQPRRNKIEDTTQSHDASIGFVLDMADIAPGRPGNLTAEQEEKLRRLWQLVFQVTGVDMGTEEAGDAASAGPESPAADAKKPKKKRISLFSRKGKKDAEEEPEAATPSKLITLKETDEDKYGQTKHFYDTLANQSPELIRSTTWSMVKHDNPDALLLRYLRARKWDIEKALVMLISTMNWRLNEMHVDDDIMIKGEGAAAEDEKSANATTKKLAADFLAQARMGKSFVHGTDKAGRPICVVRVRLHRQGEHSEESLERYTVYLIETCRFLLKPPVDTATLVFDMTGFTMANMDYTPVKFMIKCFEANYPESLGAVLVHKAPWIFQGIWKIIKGWLDPVVASKVHFTNNIKELEEYIPVKQVPKDLDGEEDWEYKYVEPVSGENDTMKDTETRDRLTAARGLLVKEYEQATVEWIQNPQGEKADAIKAKRNALAVRLREDYFALDPYIRARSLYDRTEVLLPGGKIDFYPQAKPADAKVNGVAPPETSADDVD